MDSQSLADVKKFVARCHSDTVPRYLEEEWKVIYDTSGREDGGHPLARHDLACFNDEAFFGSISK